MALAAASLRPARLTRRTVQRPYRVGPSLRLHPVGELLDRRDVDPPPLTMGAARPKPTPHAPGVNGRFDVAAQVLLYGFVAKAPRLCFVNGQAAAERRGCSRVVDDAVRVPAARRQVGLDRLHRRCKVLVHAHRLGRHADTLGGDPLAAKSITGDPCAKSSAHGTAAGFTRRQGACRG